jgi:hypothetical protein
MEDVGIFYGHLVHFMVFCYILWTFGIVCGNFIYFSPFGILYQEKSGNPGQKRDQPVLFFIAKKELAGFFRDGFEKKIGAKSGSWPMIRFKSRGQRYKKIIRTEIALNRVTR